MPSSVFAAQWALLALAPAAGLARPCVVAQEQDQPAARAAAVDALFASWDKPDSPGAAVAVARDGEIVLVRCYGSADLEHGLPITPDTVFDAASLAKSVTGLGVAMLASQGRLDLEADARDLLPDVLHLDLAITPDQLLHHTSGIRDWVGLLPLMGRSPIGILPFEEIMELARGQRELDFEPGTEFHYSNTGYNLLAEIVSRTTGSPFPEWAEQEVFRPLGMDRTRFRSDPEEPIPGLAAGYSLAPDGSWRRVPDLACAQGAGSLFLSIGDLARWSLNFDHNRVGGAEALELQLRKGVLKDGETLSYAFGIGVGSYYGHRLLNHSGDFGGHLSSLVVLPDLHLSVVLLGNARNMTSWKAMEVADVFLPPRKEDAAGSEPPAGGQEQAGTALGEVAGHWLLEPGRLLAVQRKDGAWTARTTWGGTHPLEPEGPGRFRLEGTEQVLEVDTESEQETPEVRLGNRRGRRVEPWMPGPPDLKACEGVYLCPELRVCHEITWRDGELLLHPPLSPPVPLRPTVEDQLGGKEWWAGALDLERDGTGRVVGFRVTSAKVRGVRFRRVD